MNPLRIGVLGSCGAVGRSVTRLLTIQRTGQLRLGGRHVDRVQRLNRDLDAAAEAVAVDVNDPATLATFCSGCRVIVNCAGPSHLILDRVAHAAFTAGADYVDPAGDDPLFERLLKLDIAKEGRTAVVSAGMLPGMSGILPRWLPHNRCDRLHRLTGFLCVRDQFTAAAAADYLLSLNGVWGEAGAAWRDGVRVSRVLEPLIHADLPFFRRHMNAYPYLTTELERVASSLGVREACSYNAFEDDRILSYVGRIQRAVAESGDVVAGASELARSIDLELFGRSPEQQFVYQLDGETGGRPCAYTAVLCATDTYAVTGAVTAVAVMAILKGVIPPGTHFAASVLDPHDTIEYVSACPSVTTIKLVTASTAASCLTEEGAL